MKVATLFVVLLSLIYVSYSQYTAITVEDNELVSGGNIYSLELTFNQEQNHVVFSIPFYEINQNQTLITYFYVNNDDDDFTTLSGTESIAVQTSENAYPIAGSNPVPPPDVSYNNPVLLDTSNQTSVVFLCSNYSANFNLNETFFIFVSIAFSNPTATDNILTTTEFAFSDTCSDDGFGNSGSNDWIWWTIGIIAVVLVIVIIVAAAVAGGYFFYTKKRAAYSDL